MRTKELVVQLTDLGLSEPEARIYLATLKSGPTLLAPLSKAAQMPRSSAYEVVEALAARRLILLSSLGKRTIYAAASPTQLLKDILDKEVVARQIIPQLELVMPTLETKTSSQVDTPLPFD